MRSGASEFPARSRGRCGERRCFKAEEVAAMMRLHKLGWVAKRLSKEFGCARNTVRRYVDAGGVVSYTKPVHKTTFDGLDD